METLLFKDWESSLNVLICASISFLTAFLFIRISGKRTLAKLTAFDFVVTVTLGSTLSSMILGKTVLIDGAIALIIIISLQYALAFFAQRSKTMEQVINTKPTLMFYDGQFLEKNMEKEFVTKEEVYAAIREFRLYRMEDVLAVVMELNGQLSVVKRSLLPTEQHSLSDIDELD
ncbi:DUF421 domain-containing protein [Pedobacter xixiisoli]|uniref:DUF421 domain-containing protein n=1 Tax=Pedobacter xixiisoli TaxID=1476464 RepID=A0A285ZWH0_9SPHI|nr:YetF domain-containing protein [Pedobacter xixiisoli]SOD13978.1 Protein of unknown function [Pedobacter xixiisoli]